MVALFLVAASVGLSNFAAAVSLGVAGVDARTRLRVGLVFGAFESGMPVVGLFIGSHLARQLGEASQWLGGALLIAIGLYAIIGPVVLARRRAGKRMPDGDPAPDADAAAAADPDAGPERGQGAAQAPQAGRGQLVRLLLSGLALSLDNLVIGFALGTYQVGIVTGAIIIGVVSVALSLLGLEIGARIGRWTRRANWQSLRGDQLGGVILISVGVAIAAGALT
jgi:putative Mn2+ efflux pump MntP